MKYLLLSLILLYCHIIQVLGVLEWTVVGKVTEYGQNATLFCHVPNCCPKDSGWDRWTPLQQTLFIDVKTGRPNKKYDGKIFKDGYTLIIQNLTEQDLNVSYSCLYDFTLGERKFLLVEDVFTYIRTGHSGKRRLADGEIAGIIAGVCLVLVLVTVVCFLLYIRARARGHNNGEASELAKLYEDYFMEDPINVECIKGADAVLTCKVHPGSPPVKWLRDGVELSNDENYEINNKETQHNLKIKNTKSNDCGVYDVEVGGISRQLHLKIKEVPNKAERKTLREAIKSGFELRQYVRIQVVGKSAAGKTSLVRRLLGETLEGVISTDVIDIVKKCKIRTTDGEWIMNKGATDEMDSIKMRILQAVKRKQGGGEKYQQQGSGEIYQQPEGYELGGKMTSYSLKPNSSEDRLSPAEQNENKSPPADMNTARTVVSTINENESMKNYTNIITSAPRINPYENEIKEEDIVNENIAKNFKQMPDTFENSEKDDQIIEEMIKCNDDILLNFKNKEDNLTSEGLVECGIWDFAGQKDYYATHQTFFTPYAIYIVVADIREDVNAIKYDDAFNLETSGDYVDFWLDSIHCSCEGVRDENATELNPPVIMVSTCIDKVQIVEQKNADKELETRKTEYEKNFTSTFGAQKKGNHVRDMIHFISNTSSPEEHIVNLKKHISEIAKEMHYFSEVLPTKWIQLEQALTILRDLKAKEENEYCVKWGNMEKLAMNFSIQTNELIRFLKYQHKVGNIIFFEDKRDYIILQPNWLVDCFKCLVRDPIKDARIRSDMRELDHWGRLSDNFLDKLFEKKKELKFGTYKKHILDVMEKFDIIMKPEFTNAYYMPCMITKISSLKDIKTELLVGDVNCSPWLVLEFTFLPISFYNHILFRFIRKYNICIVKEEHPAIYAGKAVVSLDHSNFTRLIICFSRNAISLQIWKWNTIDDSKYEHILKDLCIEIDDLEQTLKNNLHYEIKAKCSIGDYSTSSGRLSYEQITKKLQGGEYRCEGHDCQFNKEELVHTWLKHAAGIVNEMEERKKKRIEEKNEAIISNAGGYDVEYHRKQLATMNQNQKEKTMQTPNTDLNKSTATETSMHNSCAPTQANTEEFKATSASATKPLPTEVERTSDLRSVNKQLAGDASNKILYRNVDQYIKKLESTEEALEKTKLQLAAAVDSKNQIEQLVKQKDRDMEKINKDMPNKENDMKTNLEKMQDKDSEVQKKEKEIKKQSDEIIRLATERLELHNQIMELKGNIRVFCRVRPLLKHETKGRNGTIDHIIFPGDKKIKLVQTSDVALNEKFFTKKGHEKYEFSYDKVFSDKATQEEVFEEISQLVQSALDGFDVCIFAYGQTGSGKTYTMEGTSVNDDDRNRGMIPRAVHQIFQEIEKLKNEELIYSLEVSFLEIYNETIRDLLSDVTNYAKLDIKMAENEKNKNNKKVVVPNLTIVRNPRIEEVSDLLKRASKKRAVGETERNESSSRSHSVFSLTLTGNSNSTKKIEGTLHLVDLAGSEKFENSASEVQRKETVAINKSLSQLKYVLRSIRSNRQYISYRNSLLTRLLQNSLGGNSKTLMCVNVSPQKECIQETINSLRFAAEVNQCNIGVAKKKR